MQKLLVLCFAEKPAIAPPVFVFQKDKAQKRSAEGSSPEGGEDSDKDDGSYCPPVKRERASSLTQFPPSHSVSKNNVFMPSSFCQSPTGNSDSEPEEKTVGFRLKPPTLIHGQAPSTGVPNQKPKEQHRSVLRPALLQAPQPKAFSQSSSSSGTNGVKKPPDSSSEGSSASQNNTEASENATEEASGAAENEKDAAGVSSTNEDHAEEKQQPAESDFVFGQNVEERAKVESGAPSVNTGGGSSGSKTASGATNYFLHYSSTSSSLGPANNKDTEAKFVFGQNMYERVLSPPKSSDSFTEGSKESAAGSTSEPSSLDATPEKPSSAVIESLEESAAAYTKATAKKCLLEKVEVITGEEAESNVLQIQCKLFVFDKITQTWVERGRGLLRLNDMASTEDGTLQSRLVMRTQGSLRLILNTKLWSQMQIDKASEKSIRITAMDTEDQGVKVFLISASSNDTGQLYAALHHRIQALRSRAEQEQETKSIPAEPEVPQSNEEDSDEDDILTPAGSATASGSTDPGEAQATGST
ncbi:ran-binding protein 3-like [Acipenser oxyrinchus oxyrinchus]|uniref:Ran-binding protein 3 n=1 Tax=Acipenser oxyrinchus oxyrinchus TaxID=40147 RepID=A0AAD8FTC8_ACIOX|nr:ran-binding protein 3-like [Acipenser oxyrinchus oxyrinchus]KAK1157026.1 ran-binding protein 3-like [Acipenser oxyrinchus oxyrinchus]